MKKAYWKHPFVDHGRAAVVGGRDEAFIDRTGMPGPRSWSSQEFPPAQADHPVTGVSWYEAAAYAAFRGKDLPTVFQWEKAARTAMRPAVHHMPWGIVSPGDSLHHRANFDGTTPSR